MADLVEGEITWWDQGGWGATEGVVAVEVEASAVQRTRGSSGWCPGLRQHIAGRWPSRVWATTALVRKIGLDSKLSLEELVESHISCKCLSPSSRSLVWPPVLHHGLWSPPLGCVCLSAHHLLRLTVELVPSACSQPLLPLLTLAHSLLPATVTLIWQLLTEILISQLFFLSTYSQFFSWPFYSHQWSARVSWCSSQCWSMWRETLWDSSWSCRNSWSGHTGQPSLWEFCFRGKMQLDYCGYIFSKSNTSYSSHFPCCRKCYFSSHAWKSPLTSQVSSFHSFGL